MLSEEYNLKTLCFEIVISDDLNVSIFVIHELPIMLILRILIPRFRRNESRVLNEK